MQKQIKAPFYTERKVGLHYLFHESKLPEAACMQKVDIGQKSNPMTCPSITCTVRSLKSKDIFPYSELRISYINQITV